MLVQWSLTCYRVVVVMLVIRKHGVIQNVMKDNDPGKCKSMNDDMDVNR